MSSIKILVAVGGNTVGETIDINDEAAAYLVEGGYAEAVKATRGKATEKAPESKGGEASPSVSTQTAG